MAIASHLADYLAAHGVTYDVIEHQPTASSIDTAQQARIPSDRMLKVVLLRDKQGYMLALLPASQRVNLGHMQNRLHRPIRLATEAEIASVFSDCETGAVPAIGGAYDLVMVIDDALAGWSELYFEGGDHRSLVHISGADFRRLAATARREQLGLQS